MKKNNKKGFTLVEILVVTVILVVIILLATNAFFPLTQKAKKKAFISEIETYVKGAEVYYQIKDLNSSLEECETIDGDLVCSIDINSLEGEFVKKTDVKNEYNGCVSFKVEGTNVYDKKVSMSNGAFKYTGQASNIKDEDVLDTNEEAICSDLVDFVDEDDEILDNGYLADENIEGKAILMARKSSQSRDHFYKYAPQIKEIEFVKNKDYGDATLKWNVAQDGSDAVVAWLDKTKTKLYIGSDKEIYAPRDSDYLFLGFGKLEKISFNNFNTKNTETMAYMFYNDENLENLDLSGFNTSKVTDMGLMFTRCRKIKNIIFGEKFDTSKVTTFSYTFHECSSLESLDLSGFDTSKVTNMFAMFSMSSNLKSIEFGENFDTSKVTSFSHTFHGCSSLESLDLSGFNTSNVTDMYRMFSSCTNLKSIEFGEKFDTSKVTTFSHTFHECSSLESLDLSGFDVSKATTMYRMFSSCKNLKSIKFGKNFIPSNEKVLSHVFSNSNQNIKLCFAGPEEDYELLKPHISDLINGVEKLAKNVVYNCTKSCVESGSC